MECAPAATLGGVETWHTKTLGIDPNSSETKQSDGGESSGAFRAILSPNIFTQKQDPLQGCQARVEIHKSIIDCHRRVGIEILLGKHTPGSSVVPSDVFCRLIF